LSLKLPTLPVGANVDDPEDPLIVIPRRLQEEVFAGAEGHVDRPDGPVEEERVDVDLRDVPALLLFLSPVVQVIDILVISLVEVFQNLGG